MKITGSIGRKEACQCKWDHNYLLRNYKVINIWLDSKIKRDMLYLEHLLKIKFGIGSMYNLLSPFGH